MEELAKQEKKPRKVVKLFWLISVLLVAGLFYAGMPEPAIIILLVLFPFLWFKCTDNSIVEWIIGISILAAFTSFSMDQLQHYRATQMRERCMSNLRGAYSYLENYRKDHGGKYPESLAEIADESFDKLLHCPRDKSVQEVSYEYLGGSYANVSARRLIIMHDKESWHKGQSRCVLFGDGHVERVREGEFQKLQKQIEIWAELMEGEQERVIIEKAAQGRDMYIAIILKGQIYVLANDDYLLGPFVKQEDGYYFNEGNEIHSLTREDYEPYKWVYGHSFDRSLSEHYANGTTLDELEKGED